MMDSRGAAPKIHGNYFSDFWDSNSYLVNRDFEKKYMAFHLL